jgi:hypothetical protein
MIRKLTAAALLVMGCVVGPAKAGVITTSHYAQDHPHDIVSSEVAAVAEGRVGDSAQNNFNRTFEMDLGRDTASPAVTEQYRWMSGQATSFTLNFDEALNKLTFALGGKTLTYNPVGEFNELHIRTRATHTKSSMLVSGLTLNGMNVNDTSFADGDVPGHDLDVLRIQGVDLMGGFTLTGVATMVWGKSSPPNSHLAFQVYLTDVQTDDGGSIPGGEPQVPEPASAALAVSGLLVMLGGRPRRKARLA